MSVDLTITQRGLIKKPLPLNVILGDELAFGRYDPGWRLENGKMDDDGFIAFLPTAPARGFNVTWNAVERKRVALRLLTPTSRAEVRAFYAAVQRIARYWNGALRVEGEEIALDRWMAGLDDYLAFNEKGLSHIVQKLLDGGDESHSLALFSARWPLYLGLEEARAFSRDPAAFDAWMAEKQSVAAYYAVPGFFDAPEGGIVGMYTLAANQLSFLPKEPAVPFGAVNRATGEPMKCDRFMIALLSASPGEELGRMDYASVLDRLPPDKTARYDGRSLLIQPLTRDELQGILDRSLAE